MQYLGLSLGAKFKFKDIWHLVLEKVERRLGSWKRSYVSKGVRLTLIKSTLSNLPTFYVLVAIAKRIERIQREFLWQGIEEEFHLVNWDQICVPLIARDLERTARDYEGLAFHSLVTFNNPLLGKWL